MSYESGNLPTKLRWLDSLECLPACNDYVARRSSQCDDNCVTVTLLPFALGPVPTSPLLNPTGAYKDPRGMGQTSRAESVFKMASILGACEENMKCWKSKCKSRKSRNAGALWQSRPQWIELLTIEPSCPYFLMLGMKTIFLLYNFLSNIVLLKTMKRKTW